MDKCKICGREATILYNQDAQEHYCWDCHNKMLADLIGIDTPDSIPKQIVFFDTDKVGHTFKVECMIFPHCKSIEADEINGATFYKEAVYGELEDNWGGLWEELVRRLSRNLSVKYMKPDGYFVTDKAVGYVEYNPDGDIPNVVIDGNTYSWSDLGKVLSAYESFKIKIEFADKTDILE